ncbi:MAG: HDOD domain-containing protein [Kofleriaceae bacterium]
MAAIRDNTGEVVKAIDGLPTLPIVAMKIGEVIHSKNVSVNQIAELLRQDPSISAKLLRLVNSPYFGIPGGVSDVARAIPFVGFNTLYQLVLGISVLEALNVPGGARSLWMHSLTVATAARELAVELRCTDDGACFTAGLLHDMGKIALAKLSPERFAEAAGLVEKEGIAQEEAERRVGLAPHDRIGAHLAKQWRFPANLATPIEQHHSVYKPGVAARLAPNLRTVTEIVCAADFVAHAAAKAFDDKPNIDGAEPETNEMLERNGYSGVRLQALCDRTLKQLEKSKMFLSLVDGPAMQKAG